MIGVNDDYSVEVTCTYKGETYHVRDNVFKLHQYRLILIKQIKL